MNLLAGITMTLRRRVVGITMIRRDDLWNITLTKIIPLLAINY